MEGRARCPNKEEVLQSETAAEETATPTPYGIPFSKKVQGKIARPKPGMKNGLTNWKNSWTTFPSIGKYRQQRKMHENTMGVKGMVDNPPQNELEEKSGEEDAFEEHFNQVVSRAKRQ